MKMIGKYRVEYNKDERCYYVIAPDDLVLSSYATLADAVLAAERYIAGGLRRSK